MAKKTASSNLPPVQCRATFCSWASSSSIFPEGSDVGSALALAFGIISPSFTCHGKGNCFRLLGKGLRSRLGGRGCMTSKFWGRTSWAAFCGEAPNFVLTQINPAVTYIHEIKGIREFNRWICAFNLNPSEPFGISFKNSWRSYLLILKSKLSESS